MSNTLVLGIGNIFFSDEAIGVRIIEALEERFNIPEGVEVIEGGTCGMELMADLADKDHVIVVDAVLSKGKPPGSIVILKDQEVPVMFTRKISPHQLGLADVLSALTLTEEFPKRLTLVGVVPECLDYKEQLSDTMKRVFDDVLHRTVDVLRADGFTVTEKTV